MALFDQSARNPLGLAPGRAERVRVKARAAINKGQIVRFDLQSSDAATTASTAFGSAGDPTANVLLATNSHNGKDTTVWYLLGVAAEDISDDTEGWVYIRGVVQALGGDTSAAGTGLSPVAGSELGAVTDETRACAVALETLADATLKWVIFDGINGFGISADVAA